MLNPYPMPPNFMGGHGRRPMPPVPGDVTAQGQMSVDPNSIEERKRQLLARLASGGFGRGSSKGGFGMGFGRGMQLRKFFGPDPQQPGWMPGPPQFRFPGPGGPPQNRPGPPMPPDIMPPDQQPDVYGDVPQYMQGPWQPPVPEYIRPPMPPYQPPPPGTYY